MKYGCCVNMFGNKMDPVGMNYIGYLAESGYDYVELPLAQIMELPTEKFEQLKETLKKYNMNCECCNNFFPASVRLTGENTSLNVIEDYIRNACSRAAELGVKVIVFGSAGAKNVPEGFPEEKAFQQIVEVLKIADQHASYEGIQIAIEPLNRMESNIIVNLSDGKKLMQAVNASNIKLLVDYYHFTVEKESLDTIIENGPDIIHVHFAEPEGRIFPSGILNEYRNFFAALNNVGYDSRVSIEANSKQVRKDIGNGLAIMKNCIEN
ncbi:TIM barrel protein [Anaerocolumna sedimenticola]|uniref:TIM barrel protein n=1 Tax=Anaerocolumna sedimenticola TaxID=2696063 RepID=A0A6P1TRF9_9FIRM|nr:sugar phosphate isomerase/epimerase family protein [Anaerocolumna sedimenticola]QHQ62822.1 TIM barrel protein [Anaerocolumna sedimenticola]